MAAASTILRDRDFDAPASLTHPVKPDDRQQQFGGTLGGPIRKDRIFFYAGFDQHLLTVPSIDAVRQRRQRHRSPARRLRLSWTSNSSSAAAQQLNEHGRRPIPRPCRAMPDSPNWTSLSRRSSWHSCGISTSRSAAPTTISSILPVPITDLCGKRQWNRRRSRPKAWLRRSTSAWTNNLATNLRVAVLARCAAVVRRTPERH